MPIGRIRKAHVPRAREGDRGQGLGRASTRNIVTTVISRALSDAVEDDLIGSNPSDRRRRTGGQAKSKITVWSAVRTAGTARRGSR
jgi:hypothetical protein